MEQTFDKKQANLMHEETTAKPVKVQSSEEQAADAFFKHAYTADPSKTSGTCKVLKMMSVGIACYDFYVTSILVQHLYEYVTTIHREPDVILAMGLGHLFISCLKLAVVAFGYNMASYPSERTPENFSKMNYSTLLVTFIRVLGHFGIH